MSEIFYVNLKCAFQCKLVVSSYEDDIVIVVISKSHFQQDITGISVLNIDQLNHVNYW